VADILLPHGVVKAGVFGSVAKGEEMPESDVDFPVELESARTLLDLSGLRLDLMDRYRLNREVDVEVDVVTYRALHPKLRDRILREQISILCVALPGAGVRWSKRATINLGNKASMTFLNVDKHGRSTLPEHVRRDLGIDGDEGALVVLEKTARGTWKRVPAALVPRDQLWLHHPELRDRLEEAERDFREGSMASTGPRFPGKGPFLGKSRIRIGREARRVPSTVTDQASVPRRRLRGSS
jgi:predicted nucleotidyltransferase/bifunctional DNA-binding transcriptional regulator/antitoxin component of YhaV-PrlF toxin-antitoxin module